MRSQRRESELRKDGQHGTEAAALKLRELTEKATPLINSCRPNSTPEGQSVPPQPHTQLVSATADDCSLRQNHKGSQQGVNVWGNSYATHPDLVSVHCVHVLRSLYPQIHTIVMYVTTEYMGWDVGPRQ
jgi:hypothetical protein